MTSASLETQRTSRFSLTLHSKMPKHDGCQIPPHDSMPNWAEQVSRVTCPCTDRECGCELARGGMAVTLGELFSVARRSAHSSARLCLLPLAPHHRGKATAGPRGPQASLWRRDGCRARSITSCSIETAAHAQQGAARRGVRRCEQVWPPCYDQ